MFTLAFQDPANGDSYQVGPAPYYRLFHGSLRAGPSDQEIARHQRWAWRLGERRFLVVATHSPTLVRFGDEGKSGWDAYTSSAGITLVDGGIWLGPRSGEFLAKFNDEADYWYVFHSHRHWPNVGFYPA